MILCNKLKNRLCKIVTKSQVVTELNVTSCHLIEIALYFEIWINYFCILTCRKKIYSRHFLELFPDFKQKSKIPKNSNAISKRIGPHCDIHSRQLGNNNFHSLRMRMTTSSNAPKTQARTHYGFSYFTLYSNNDMTTSSYHIRIVRVSQNLCLT